MFHKSLNFDFRLDSTAYHIILFYCISYSLPKSFPSVTVPDPLAGAYRKRLFDRSCRGRLRTTVRHRIGDKLPARTTLRHSSHDTLRAMSKCVTT